MSLHPPLPSQAFRDRLLQHTILPGQHIASKAGRAKSGRGREGSERKDEKSKEEAMGGVCGLNPALFGETETEHYLVRTPVANLITPCGCRYDTSRG